MTTPEELEKLVAAGESETLELKKATGQLTSAGKTLCALLNTAGGAVVIGATPGGRLLGQEVTDTTKQKIAAMLRLLDPFPDIEVEYVDLTDKLQAIVLRVVKLNDARPYVFDGRPYERIQSNEEKKGPGLSFEFCQTDGDGFGGSRAAAGRAKSPCGSWPLRIPLIMPAG